jgi:hypothetical protein
MKRLFPLAAILFFMVSFNTESFSQSVSAKEQCAKMGRGVNVIGYDDALWKDHTKGRFKETYFKMIKDAGFSTT